MPTPAELLAQSLTALRNAKRFSGSSNSYRKDNPTEYTKVLKYLDGGARPTGSLTEMGRHAVLEEDVRRSLLPTDPDPPPTTWSPPLTVTTGGTYSGNWESTSSTPAVTIATPAPVTITGRVRNLTGGTLIDAVGAGAVQVTIDHVFAYGGDTYQTSGRFFQAEGFKAVTIRNCTIENTRGIELQGVASPTGSSVLITRNRHKNIQGGPNANPVGNFVQFRHVSAVSEVTWNEIVNEYDKSHPEDIISIYHSSNVRVLDNMLWHQSLPGNAYNNSSQGGITIDSSDAGPNCDNIDVIGNQVVDGLGIVSYINFGGSDCRLLDNRIIADGYLPNGEKTGNGWGSPLVIIPGPGTNNHAHGNVVGYIDRDGAHPLDPFDANYPTHAAQALRGADEGGIAEQANNTFLPKPITKAMEDAEWQRWLDKLVANGITIGA